MAVLATPKKNSYILKKESVDKIVQSKNTKAEILSIEEKASVFKFNNLKKR